VSRGLLALLSLIGFWSGFALAGNTSTVFGPVVNEGHKSWQGRTGFDPDSDALVNRLHYQRAVSDDLQWRFIAQTRKTDDRTLDLDLFEGEVTLQLTEDSANWQQGLRFDLLAREATERHSFSVSWMHQVPLSKRWRGRALMQVGREFGGDRRGGVSFQTRASVAYKASDRWSLIIEMYNAYGSTVEGRSYEEQRHQIGPMVSYKFDGGWSVNAGALFGVSRASPDTNYRLFLGKRL